MTSCRFHPTRKNVRSTEYGVRATPWLRRVEDRGFKAWTNDLEPGMSVCVEQLRTYVDIPRTAKAIRIWAHATDDGPDGTRMHVVPCTTLDALLVFDDESLPQNNYAPSRPCVEYVRISFFKWVAACDKKGLRWFNVEYR